jgi:hypothetical protein
MRLGFSTSSSFISKAIKRWTKSKVSHCYIVYRDQTFCSDMVIHATDWRVKIIMYAEFARKTKVVEEFNLLDGEGISGHKGLVSVAPLLDKKYDIWGLFGYMWVLIGRFFGRSWRNPLASDDKYVCSEFGGLWARDSGVPGFEDVDLETLTQQDLLEMVEDSSHFQKVSFPKRTSWWTRWFRRKKVT